MLNNPIIIGGTSLPTLTNPGTAGDLLLGKQLIGQNGDVVTGTMRTKSTLIIARTYRTGDTRDPILLYAPELNPNGVPVSLSLSSNPSLEFQWFSIPKAAFGRLMPIGPIDIANIGMGTDTITVQAEAVGTTKTGFYIQGTETEDPSETLWFNVTVTA